MEKYWKIILLCVVFFSIGCSTTIKKTNSPDNNIRTEFGIKKGGEPYYKVFHHDSLIIEDSRLGLVMDSVDFSNDMSLDSVSGPISVDENYSMLYGKQKEISYNAIEKTFHLKHSSDKLMDVIFRVSNDGVAFRYRFANKSDRLHRISEEKTTYNFPDSSRAWLKPLKNARTGWARNKPSYEEFYNENVKVGTAAPDSAGWAYPALFKTGDTWTLISEAGMDGSYCGTRLKQNAPGGEYYVGFPQWREQLPDQTLLPNSRLPWSTPWRIIAIGDLETITESTLGTDLAAPAVDMDTSWIKPGRASWSWAKLKDPSMKYDTQKRFVDYADEMGWEYTLIDAYWDSRVGYKKIKQLADYAAKKNVGLLLWYNSSGSWNDTPHTPKNKLLTHKGRIEEFSRLQKMGIKGIKVDFFGGDGQSMIEYYRDIFRDAAKYQLLVNTHGATLPRGWSRTWPNLMTVEAVRGFEFITFDQQNADKEASHSAMLPFTRNVFDPMDFTPMSLTQLTKMQRKTTSGFELALPILFTSGIQHYAETANGMQKVPKYVQEFIKKIPVSWDEMEFITGFPGKSVVIGRRKGNKWFVAGINGENKTKTLTLDLSFLTDDMSGEMISNGDTQFSFEHKKIKLSQTKEIEVSLQGNGGFVMLFQK